MKSSVLEMEKKSLRALLDLKQIIENHPDFMPTKKQKLEGVKSSIDRKEKRIIQLEKEVYYEK